MDKALFLLAASIGTENHFQRETLHSRQRVHVDDDSILLAIELQSLSLRKLYQPGRAEYLSRVASQIIDSV